MKNVSDNSRVPLALWCGCLLLYVALRSLAPYADPVPLDFSVSAFGDAGYYSLNARSWALWGRWSDCRWLMVWIFPGYELPLALWFRLVGDSFISLRLFHGIFHGLGALATVLAVRRLWGDRPALWTAFFWTVNWAAIAGSRNGWVENVIVAWLGLGFAAIVLLPALPAAAVSGLLFGLTVATKPYMLAFLPGPLLALGRERRRWCIFALGFLLVVIPYAWGWLHFRATQPETYLMTFNGIFVGRDQAGLGALLLRACRLPELFATTFFARSAVETLLFGGGLAWLAVAPVRRLAAGERWIAGGLLGLLALYAIMGHRTIRYYLPLLPLMLPLAGRMAALAPEGLAACLAAASPWRRRPALFFGAFVAAGAFIWSASPAFLPRQPHFWLEHFGWALAAVVALAALLVAFMNFAAARFSRPPHLLWVGGIVLGAVILSGAQYGQWWLRKRSDLADASTALARLHPPAKVFGWLAPTLSLGTPHEVFWDWGKPDRPEYYRALYGCRYWWRTSLEADTAIPGRLLAEYPCEVAGHKLNVMVYDLESQP